jgi:hypothetical protein
MTAVPPLLLLAEGRNPRPRRAPLCRPKEITLHMAVAKLLRDHALPEWQWTHVPDFILVPPAGQLHCLELKRQGETLSDAQERFQLWCIRHGVPHSVAYSVDDALAVLNAWGCLRWRHAA